jgi:Uma2 family endonuclease
MPTAALKRYTPEEYLARERTAEFKSEYIDGQIVAMSGAPRLHNLIVHNLDREIGVRLLDSPCEIYSGDMKVFIDASGRYVYPDLCVSCAPEFADSVADVLLTPVLIVEVLSESTEQYDRGEKFLHYRRVELLREYVLISQKEARVEQYVRSGDLWPRTVVTGLDGSLVLASVGLEIPLNRLYQKVLVPPRHGPRAVQNGA